MKKILLFFSYLGRKYYGERIGIRFAWALADAMEPFADFMSEWEPLEDWEDEK